MKKLTILALTAVMMAGCDVSKSRDTELCEERYHVIVIDSCEYLSYKRGWDLTHKGNCRFCKERREKEMKELIEELKMNSYGNVH